MLFADVYIVMLSVNRYCHKYNQQNRCSFTSKQSGMVEARRLRQKPKSCGTQATITSLCAPTRNGVQDSLHYRTECTTDIRLNKQPHSQTKVKILTDSMYSSLTAINSLLAQVCPAALWPSGCNYSGVVLNVYLSRGYTKSDNYLFQQTRRFPVHCSRLVGWEGQMSLIF